MPMAKAIAAKSARAEHADTTTADDSHGNRSSASATATAAIANASVRIEYRIGMRSLLRRWFFPPFRLKEFLPNASLVIGKECSVLLRRPILVERGP